jgi:hypothetical protein
MKQARAADATMVPKYREAPVLLVDFNDKQEDRRP